MRGEHSTRNVASTKFFCQLGHHLDWLRYVRVVVPGNPDRHYLRLGASTTGALSQIPCWAYPTLDSLRTLFEEPEEFPS